MAAGTNAPGPCEHLAWDSEHFGRRIGRLTTGRPSDDELRQALAWCEEQSIDCLYLLADAGDPPSVRRAEAAGFGLVDVRVTLERPLGAGTESGVTGRGDDPSARRDLGGPNRTATGTDARAAGPPVVAARAVAIRAAVVPDDLAALADVAAAAHRGTRFFIDPRFPDADCERLYRAWIDNSARGWADAVLVAELPAGDPGALAAAEPLAGGGETGGGGRGTGTGGTGANGNGAPPAGYVTCHLDGAAGSIGLIGVDARCRGAGLGGALVAAALDWLAAHGATRAEVATQGANVAAQRLYQRAGFVTREVGLWYHLWPRAARLGAGDAAG